jgi:hypothetical protein
MKAICSRKKRKEPLLLVDLEEDCTELLLFGKLDLEEFQFKGPCDRVAVSIFSHK